MREVLVGRQAVFDRSVVVSGYQVLLALATGTARDASTGEGPVVDPVATLMEFDLGELVGDRTAFLPLPRTIPAEELADALSPQQVVFELGPRDGTVDMDVLRAVAAYGFGILAEAPPSGSWDPALLALASYTRIDVADREPASLREEVARLRDRGKFVIARNVDTAPLFDEFRGAGFVGFQGRWLEKPRLVKGQRPPQDQLNLLRLLSLVNDGDASLDEIEGFVTQDVTLSYRLVRTVNSVAFGLRHPVESIKQAMMTLGLDRLRTWITLLSVSGVGEKPRELVTTALVRARMCELLARAINHPDPDRLVTVGLFSVLDALLDLPMEDVLRDLNLADDLSEALGSEAGLAGQILHSVRAQERGAWDEVELPSLSSGEVTGIFLEALVWADDTLAQLA